MGLVSTSPLPCRGRFFRRRRWRRPSPALLLPLLWRGGVGGARSCVRRGLLLPSSLVEPLSRRKTLHNSAGLADGRPSHVCDVDGPLPEAGACPLPIISCVGIVARPFGGRHFGVLFSFSKRAECRHLELVDVGLLEDFGAGRRHLASFEDPSFRLKFARKLMTDPLPFGRTNPAVVLIHLRMARGRRVRGGKLECPRRRRPLQSAARR